MFISFSYIQIILIKYIDMINKLLNNIFTLIDYIYDNKKIQVQ